MTPRSFPIIYTGDVGSSLAFYRELGFDPYYHHPDSDDPNYVGLRRGDSDIGIVARSSPKELLDVEMGTQPRFELFIYVDSVDTQIERLRQSGVPVIREPEDMPWGDRLGYVTDPDGNPVVLAVSGSDR